MVALDLARQWQTQFPDSLTAPTEFRGEVSVALLAPQRLPELCAFAKQRLGFDFLVDITSVDHEENRPRFEVVYELYGHTHHQHLRLKVPVPDDTGALPTVTTVWRGADWHEREIYDLMGIQFTGHPDLRRLLMWEGYPYHPLRKDFPLAGLPTDLPEVAFTSPAPMEGGPFVTAIGSPHAEAREPRARGTEPPA